MAGGVPSLLPPLMPSARLREIATAMGAFAVGALRLTTGDLGAESYTHIGHLHIALLKAPPEPTAAPGELVLMTSGTSGFPRLRLRFRGDSAQRQAPRGCDCQRADDTVLLNLPLYFSFALSSQALGSLTRGNRLIISGPPFIRRVIRSSEAVRRDCLLADAGAYPFLLSVRSQRACRGESTLRGRRSALIRRWRRGWLNCAEARTSISPMG